MPYDINELLKKPELYKETGIPFWDDEHISKQQTASPAKNIRAFEAGWEVLA